MKPPRPVPLRSVRVTGATDRQVTFRGAGLSGELTVLAPDLFRLRIHRGAPHPAPASWAVGTTDWPAVDTMIRRSARRVDVRTAGGQWTLDLARGAWQVTDPGGLVVFDAPSEGTRFEGRAAALELRLAEREALFGLGETTGQFNKRGLVREFWNIDVLGHSPAIHPGLRHLYVSIPFALSLRDGRAAGLFWDNPTRQSWDLGQSASDRWRLRAEDGEIDLYLFLGPSLPGVVERYTALTGRIPLPPRWALGYQQSRYGYESAARVDQVARELRRRHIPCDVLHLDIHHLDGHRVFTFGKGFPDPGRWIARLARRGFRVVGIVDPGVKDDPRFGVLRRGRQAGAFVRDAGGREDFLGEVWPGRARFPDFLNASARKWLGDEQAALTGLGVAGFWNDMNEPANFARPDKTLPPDARHTTDHGPAAHRDVHNVYGMQMARASREGALRHAPDRRPYVITRSTYAGGQRDAVVWTGDNSSHWDHLADAVQMLLNLGLSGVANCGADVGGFRDGCTGELLARWTQMAAFTPFFRNHSDLGTIDQEPWAFGPEVEAVCRAYIGLRYRMVPGWTCLLAEARATGAPPMRPLAWHYQNDPVAVACGDQFLLGRDLMVAPVLRQGATARSVYLPNDVWFDFWTGERLTGGTHHLADAPLECLPLLVRAGAILPLMDPVEHLDGPAPRTVTLNLFPGPEGRLDWYEDDGLTQAYERGGCHRRTLTSTTRRRTLRLEFDAPTGDRTSDVVDWQLIVWDAGPRTRLRVDGREVSGEHLADSRLFTARVANQPGGFTAEISRL